MSPSTATFLRPPGPPSSHLLSPFPFYLLAAIAHLSVLPGANAYSWNFRGNPQQCQNLTIDLMGNDGTPPFRVLTIPFGASPLPNNTEVRTITEQMFPNNQRSVSFQLKYPANSQFVTVVSDASGFGTGGTSVAAQVSESSDSSCFDPTQNVSPDFIFAIEPPNQVVQCQPMRIWWVPGNVQGTPNFLGVIPGGQSFAIPRGQITQIEQQGTGFTWTPNVRGGTTLMLVGGDDRGNGTAGSVFAVVSAGINPNSTCLDGSSPSSTPGSPAGGSYPTGSNGGSVGGGNNSSSGGSNTGAIAGGAIAGVVVILAVILTLFFLRRRSQNKKKAKERPVDLFHEYEDEDEGETHQPPDPRPTHQLDYYTPEPFMVPDPTLASETDGHSQFAGTSSGRPLSGTSQTYSRSGTPDLLGGSQGGYGWAAGGSATTTSRKGQPFRMRPVNIVQHEDAGPTPQHATGKDEEPETIELPPAYTALNAAVPAAPAATTGENNGTTPLRTAVGTATPGNRDG